MISSTDMSTQAPPANSPGFDPDFKMRFLLSEKSMLAGYILPPCRNVFWTFPLAFPATPAAVVYRCRINAIKYRYVSTFGVGIIRLLASVVRDVERLQVYTGNLFLKSVLSVVVHVTVVALFCFVRQGVLVFPMLSCGAINPGIRSMPSFDSEPACHLRHLHLQCLTLPIQAALVNKIFGD